MYGEQKLLHTIMKPQNLFILFCLAFLSVNTYAAKFNCVLRGTVVGRTSKAIILKKASADPRSAMQVEIPIVGNQFEYTMVSDDADAWQLIFEEELPVAFKPVIFFADTSLINFILFPMNEAEEKNKIIGGALNREYYSRFAALSGRFKTRYLAMRDLRNELIKKKEYYTSGYDSLSMLIQRTGSTAQQQILSRKIKKLMETGNHLTPIGKKNQTEEERIIDEMFDFRYDYIIKNPGPVAYQLICEDIQPSSERPYLLNLIQRAYKAFADSKTNKIYAQNIAIRIAGKQLRPGKPFIDFTAQSMDGKAYKFSRLLNNKITVLDLWASWCGPCIAKSRQIIPVYNEFKEKGLQVIGIAREFKDLENLKTALKREKYPWLNLADLEGRNGIWDKYGLSYSGGGIFLFDQKGNILAINPTPQELRNALISVIK